MNRIFIRQKLAAALHLFANKLEGKFKTTMCADDVIPSDSFQRAAWIRFKLAEKGLSLKALAERDGCPYSVIRQAITKRKPHGERVIAHAIGVTPSQIWPERYPLQEDSTEAA